MRSWCRRSGGEGGEVGPGFGSLVWDHLVILSQKEVE